MAFSKACHGGVQFDGEVAHFYKKEESICPFLSTRIIYKGLCHFTHNFNGCS